jgi:hypothetical protein
MGYAKKLFQDGLAGAGQKQAVFLYQYRGIVCRAGYGYYPVTGDHRRAQL